MNISFVWVLQHVAREDTDDEDVKLLGVYSSPQSAEVAISRFRQLPGFQDYPESFYIGQHELDRDQWTEGFVTERFDDEPVALPATPKDGHG